jgi:hypothetical protein
MKPLVLVLVMLTAGPACAAPSWTKAPSTLEKGRIFAVGSASSMEGALAAALAQAAGLIHRERMANAPVFSHPGSIMEKGSEDSRDRSMTLKGFVKENFGPVRITVLSKDYLAEEAGKQSQLVSESCKVTFPKDGKQYEIRTYLASEAGSERMASKEEASTSAESTGLELGDLMKELSSQGFRIKQWRNSSDYTQFVALSHDGGVEKK